MLVLSGPFSIDIRHPASTSNFGGFGDFDGHRLVAYEHAHKEKNEVRSGGSWAGAVEQNCGSALLTQRREPCTAYRFPPAPTAGNATEFLSGRFLTSTPACGPRFETFRRTARPRHTTLTRLKQRSF
jgi:hypothetical protein